MAPALLALIPALAQLAPGIVRHLAGERAGEVAKDVGLALRAVVGSEDPAELELALRDPAKAADLRLELARIEEQHETERMRLLLADVAGARAQTVELARAGSVVAWGAPIVSAIVLVAFGAAVWVVLTRQLPAGSQEVALYTLGALQAMAMAVVGYWVGSSAGSARKDAALREVVRR